MTLTDVSLHIAAVLAGAAFVGLIITGRLIARSRYQPRASEPYAGFQTAAHTDTGEFLQLACEGHCPGTTAHEVTGDDGATCVLCSTPRRIPAPDAA